jgi:outer membrane protein assembly factor BamB
VAVTCYDMEGKKELWKQRVEGSFSGSPVIADGKLYAVNEKGRTFVLDISSESAKVIARNDLTGTIQATPAVANGAIFLRSDKWLLLCRKVVPIHAGVQSD